MRGIDKLGLGAAVIGMSLSIGCAHRQLRWDTIKQSQTLTSIFEQQVLDNVAMFVYSPDSLPFFSFPNAGGSDVNDSGNIAGAINWARAAPGFDSANLGLGANRSLTESWTLTPITDPRKLERMRCAYQQAIVPCTGGTMSAACPNCERAFKEFYGSDLKDPKEVVGPDGGPARVTSACIGHNCWFGFGCKKCVPRGCGCECIKVGHHCGVYVWVLPAGQEELTKLTLAILDFAMYDAPPPPTKNVTWYFDADGNPSNSENAARVEEATLLYLAETPERLPPVAAPPRPNAQGPQATRPFEAIPPGMQVGPQGVSQIPPTQPVPSYIPNANFLQFQQDLRFLTPRR